MNRPAVDEIKAMLVRRWGEMGGYWGINRTMAEIHALLFISTQPLCTDDVMNQLQISRGNASMNLRGLVDWGLIRRVHQLGDRKEYFQADTDVWHMFETIMRERRRREVEPIVATIDRCLELAQPGAATAKGASAAEVNEMRHRLEGLRSFLQAMGSLFELTLRLGGDGIAGVAQLLDANPAALAAAGSAKPRSSPGSAPQAPRKIPAAGPPSVRPAPRPRAARAAPANGSARSGAGRA